MRISPFECYALVQYELDHRDDEDGQRFGKYRVQVELFDQDEQQQRGHSDSGTADGVKDQEAFEETIPHLEVQAGVQEKIVDAIKMGMSLDPNMTPEMIEEYTPAIEQIVMTNAKYGK